MSKFTLILVVGTASWLTVANSAAAQNGFYFSLGADRSDLREADSHLDIPLPTFLPPPFGGIGVPASSMATNETGFGVRAAIGTSFRSNFRIEGEFAYRANDISKLSVEADDPAVSHDGITIPQSIATLISIDHDIDGSLEAASLIANIYYDFNPSGRWAPYVGIGVGIAAATVEMECVTERICVGNPNLPTTEWIDSDDTVPVAKGSAGLGYNIEVAGNAAAITLDYSYVSLRDPELTNALTSEVFEAHFHGHFIGVGFRMPFGQ